MDTLKKYRQIPSQNDLIEALQVWTPVIYETGNWQPVAKHILDIFLPIIKELQEDKFWQDKYATMIQSPCACCSQVTPPCQDGCGCSAPSEE